MEMGVVAGVAGKEVVKKAVNIALGSLVDLIKYEWGLEVSVKKGLESLKTELSYMKVSIEHVSSEPQDEINPADKIWLAEVMELSCAIETGLKSFVSRIDSAKGTLFSAATKFYINHDMDSFIRKNMTKAKEVSEQRGRYGFSSSSQQKKEVGPRFYAHYTRDALVDIPGETELTNMLSENKHVSIFGMVGLGKTTLARRVYDKMKDDFKCCAFVHVGQHDDVDKGANKVLTYILNALSVKIRGHSPETWELANQLRDAIKDQRFLFVIDDLWDKKTWAQIEDALRGVGSAESRVITTTRKLSVAEGVGGVHRMKALSLSKSKELLLATISKAEATNHDTGDFDKLLSKCGGVPSAIIGIGSLLAKKPRREWSKVYDSIGSAVHTEEDVIKNIMEIMSYSYNDLPLHLRKCFLYLSLFPRDHWIEKNMLIWRWIAEGLVAGGLFEVGERYFNDLINMSMIQRAESPRDIGQGGCRVHDMMLLLIREQSSKDNFSTVLDGKQESTDQALRPTFRLAIHEFQNNIPLPDKNANTSLQVGRVRSLYASSCPGSRLPSLSEFSLLRVMDLECCNLSVGDCKLNNLGKLPELAYMGLLGTPVAELPKEIGDLEHLQTLDVTGTGSTELPLFIEKLKKLRCLRAGKGTIMKGRVGKLTSLEELWLHSADKSRDFATELRKLTKLRVLVVHFDKMDQAMGDDLVKSLSDLTELQILQIWSDDTSEEKVYFSSWGHSVPSEKLRQLLLFGVILPKDTPWIHSCVCGDYLSKLLLQVETLEAVHLEILGQMPSLVSVYLHSEDGNQLSYTAGKDEFKLVEYLYTNIELVCGDGGLPRMQELEVAGIRVGTDVGLQGNMPLLERATYHLDCMFCGPEVVRWEEAKLRQASEGHPNHPAVSIKRFNIAGLELNSLLLRYMPEIAKELLTPHAVGASSDTESLLHNLLEIPAFADLISKATAQSSATVGAPPTLAVGDDAGTSSPSSPSSPSPLVKVSTSGSETHFLAYIGAYSGLDPAVTLNMMGNWIKSPEGVAMMNNTMWKEDGSLPASEAIKMMQAMAPAIISLFEQNEDVLGSGARTLPNDMVMMAMFSAMSQAANSAGGTQKFNNQIDKINADGLLAAFESIASNGMLGLEGTYLADARSMVEKATQNPEFVECIKSTARNAGGPQFGSDLAKVLELFMSHMDLPAESGKGKHAAEHTCADARRESLPEVTADSLIAWLETQDGAVFLSERASCHRMSRVAFRKLIEKHVQKPEMIASLDSARQSMGFSGMARLLMQQLRPEMIDHFIRQFMPMPSSTPGYTGGGGQADASGMLSSLLSNLAVSSQMADPTAEHASVDAAARSSAGVAPASSQDAENFSRMLKQLLPAVEHKQAASPSSKPDNVGIKEGGTD